MSSCPAYLGVVINNRLELDELFRYDLLILCPTEFNLTFKVTLCCCARHKMSISRELLIALAYKLYSIAYE